MRALVIDDSRAMRAILKKLLGELGFDVVEAGDGAEALRLIRDQGRPDLALVDWNMPEMTGLEFIRAVRAEREWDRLALVMVTTETEPAQVVRALNAGADEYVMKPFTREVLVEKLALVGIKV